MLKLPLPGSRPLCPTATGSQGTQPAAPSLRGLLLLSIPAFHHLQVPSALLFSKLVLLPPFMFFASVSPLSSGKSLRNPPPKHVFFPAPTLPSSLRTYLLHICIARLIPSMFPTRCKSKARSHPFPWGCTASPQTPPRLTALLLSPWRGKPLPMAEHHPSAHGASMSQGAQQSGYRSPAAPELGAEQAGGWRWGFAGPHMALPLADGSVPQQDTHTQARLGHSQSPLAPPCTEGPAG